MKLQDGGDAMAAGRESGEWKELARRRSDGLDIALLWSKSLDRVKLSVFGVRFREHFEVDVAGADALAAFNHPFAYAARRGLDVSAVTRAVPALQFQD